MRHAGWVALLSVLLALFSAPFTVSLYKNLRTDIEELLPRSARSVLDLETVEGRLESTTNLGILVFSKDARASRRFVDDLAAAIERERSPLVTRVEYRIDRELEFFRRRQALFLPVPDLRRIRDYVRARIDYESGIRNPLNIFSGEALREPKLDFRGLRERYSRRVESFTRFKDGYYANRDESVRALLVFLAGNSGGIGNALGLRALVDSRIAELGPASYAPDLSVRFTGDVQNLVEEHASLIADLELSGIIVTLLVALSLLVFFRDWLATAALAGSLLVGTLASFAIAYFAVGYLNANSAFLGSIVLGNGINFGIIVLARYFEERGSRRGARAVEDSMAAATSATVKSTLTAALAAGLSYGSLMLTGFRGFKQFGMIGMVGMVVCWLSAFVTLPAFLALADRWRAGRRVRAAGRKGGARPPGGLLTRATARAVERAPRLVLAACGVLAALSLVAPARFEGDILETDVSRLRDAKSMSAGSGFLSRYLDEIFERYTSPVVILAPSRAATKEMARRLERSRAGGEGKGLIAGVYSIDTFVPDRQPEKAALLREIRSMLTPRIQRRMSASDRRLASRLLDPAALRPFGVSDLPKQVRDRFRENDGALGRLVLVEPVFDKSVLNDAENQARFIGELRRVADSVSPGAPVVGQLPVTVDMYQSVKRDGPKATLFALCAVVLLAVALFRGLGTVSYVLGSLFLGVLWLGGVIFWQGYRINFLNFIALPITFGIGVDYAVNVVQRYRLEGRGSILRVIRSTGGAVALASLTTIIGYGSLLVAGNRGFVSFGRIAILGELACLLASVLALPAWIHLRDSRRDARHRACTVSGNDQEVLVSMAPISLKAHNVLDYVIGVVLLLTPGIFGFSDIDAARNTFLVLGGGLIAYSLLTNYRYSVFKVIPLGVHMAMDVAAGVFTMLAPFALGYGDRITGFQLFVHFALGSGAIGLVALTRSRTEAEAAVRDPQDIEYRRAA